MEKLSKQLKRYGVKPGDVVSFRFDSTTEEGPIAEDNDLQGFPRREVRALFFPTADNVDCHEGAGYLVPIGTDAGLPRLETFSTRGEVVRVVRPASLEGTTLSQGAGAARAVDSELVRLLVSAGHSETEARRIAGGPARY